MNEELRLWAGASIRTVLQGQSIIDSPRLQVQSPEEAEAFLECYGFDYNQDEDRREIEAIRQEAIGFIEEVLLEEGEEMPPEVRNQENLLKLLLWVSSPEATPRSRWSCVVLRVMHTFAHCGSYFNERYHDQIKEQIFGRFEQHIRQTSNGTFLGDIELVVYESRSSKSRRSAVLKLLHKAENVAADIFDWLGIRIVTRDPLDALRVLCYLRQNNIVMFANIKPSRSRNSLIDVEWMEERWKDVEDFSQLTADLEKIKSPDDAKRLTDNSFSGSSYKALQFTCRQRIKLQEGEGKQIRFYFPFEIQILDEASYLSNHSGAASHAQYKQRQVQAVRRRVLGSLCKKRPHEIAPGSPGPAEKDPDDKDRDDEIQPAHLRISIQG
ncbi:TIGR04552 family protein [Kiloniella laminariae]|uniref:TIGR04552 family protein n=1 Tax=Kiloniella laminariae TaxID=454162 RepID=A0ABT4LEQ0_9PROT|nr:TIGR04552 family protein [Kiloniella laminariae]MCZ4279578.1 TIGR04552 family protein [Kiloniella laminariae]